MASAALSHFPCSKSARQFPYASNSKRLQPPLSLSFPLNHSLRCRPMGILSPRLPAKFEIACAGGDGNNGVGRRGGGGGNNGGSKGDSDSESDSNVSPKGVSIGWREEVEADPQLPLKVLMEELISISACVLGDTVLRPDFDFNRLDFVFSTLVIGSVLNSTLLLYHLVNKASASAVFVYCANNPMLVAAGFASGLVGTAISNRLIKMAKKMAPDSELPPNYPRSAVLNALTWAIHLGISSNLRCQILAGINCLFAKSVPPSAFNASASVSRCLNNILGGMSFVILVRLISLMEKDQKIKKIEMRMKEREMSFKLSEERKMTLKLTPLSPFVTFWVNDQLQEGQIVRSAGLILPICSMLYSHKTTDEKETRL